MELEKLPGGRLVYPDEGKKIVVKRKYEKNITWQEAAAWVNEKWEWNITDKQASTWASEYRAKEEGVGTTGVMGRGGRRWTEAESDFLREAYSLNLPARDIAMLMNETPEFEGIRNYTTRGIIVRAQRMGLKQNPNIIRKDTKTKEDYEKRLASEGFTLLEYKGASYYRTKCNTCGLEKIGCKISKKHSCIGCIEMPYSYHEIYLLKFSDFDYPSVKVGRSSDYHEKRKKGFPSHELIELWETNFTTAVAIEELIKEKYGIYSTDPHELQYGNGYSGSTECYDISQLEAIKETIKEKLNG